MDPIAAIGFAANIVQFIDFVSHLFDIGTQIRRDGIPQYQGSLQKSADRLKSQAEKLEFPVSKSSSSSDQKLHEIAIDCKAIADELRRALEKQSSKEAHERQRHEEQHKCQDKHGCKWKQSRLRTIPQAFRAMWHKKEIEALSSRLDLHRQMLDSHVLIDIRADMKKDGILLGQIKSLNENIRDTVKKDADGLKLLQRKLTLMEEAAQNQQSLLLNIVNTLLDQIRSGELFARLPKELISLDKTLVTDVTVHKTAAEELVLKSLEFRTMVVRELDVETAHDSSFQWIYKTQHSEKTSFASLAHYLKNDSGLYWICGQAGSGKSTLMKYLTRHPLTFELLSDWAGSNTLITASYFFWRAGTEMQKNHAGLLRSLLHSILSKRPDLIRLVFPGSYARGNVTSSHAETFSNIELVELKEALLTISAQATLNIHICLFIDGLDEFVGDQSWLLDFVTGLTHKAQFIKAVVSSRPEPIFVDGLHSKPKLSLEELTKEDIVAYVTSRLQESSRFRNTQVQDPLTAHRLIQLIVSRASGVFLWVKLVVRSVLQGLGDGNKFFELEKLIDEYPEEIHELFAHMFSRLKPAYRVEASRFFQYVFEGKRIEGDTPNAFRLSFLDENNPSAALESPRESLMLFEASKILCDIKDRLRSRCCGLLKVSYPKNLDILARPDEVRIAFLHRSVWDFWNRSDIRELIQRETQMSSFNAEFGLMASILFLIKRLSTPVPTGNSGRENREAFLNNVKNFLTYCGSGQDGSGNCRTEYLVEFDKVISRLWRNERWYTIKRKGWAALCCEFLGLKDDSQFNIDPILLLAAEYGLHPFAVIYMKDKAQTQQDSTYILGSLIYMALNWTKYIALKECFDMIKMHLYSKVDVNTINYGSLTLTASPMAALLSVNPWDLNCSSTWFDIMILFLESGAELNRPASGSRDHRHIRTRILNRLQKPPHVSLSERNDQEVEQRVGVLRDLIESQTKFDSTTLSGTLPENATLSQKSRKAARRERRRDKSISSEPKLLDERFAEGSSTRDGAQGVPAQECARCKAVKHLEDMGFTTKEALVALAQATPSNDIATATAWLLDHPQLVLNSESSPESELRNTNHHQTPSLRKKNPKTLSWTPVASKRTSIAKSGSSWAAVVGAELAQPIDPVDGQRSANIRRREQKRKKMGNAEHVSSNFAGAVREEMVRMGSIELSGGRRFTWIIEVDQTNGAQKPRNLETLESCDIAAIERDISKK